MLKERDVTCTGRGYDGEGDGGEDEDQPQYYERPTPRDGCKQPGHN